MRRLESTEDAEHYWRIAAEAHRDVGFPPEVFGFYRGLEELTAPGGDAVTAAAYEAIYDYRLLLSPAP